MITLGKAGSGSARASGISGTVAAALLGLVVAVVLPVAVVVIVRRLRRENPSPEGFVRMPAIRVSPEPGEPAAPTRAIGATVRLEQDQLEELAEILRRGERPG